MSKFERRDFSNLSIEGQAKFFVKLADILQDCSRENWTGYGANEISIHSINYILEFLRDLPKDIPLPDLDPEPTGGLTMVWREASYHLIVGIDQNGLISWSGTSEKGRIHGQVHFHNCIPKDLIDILYTLTRKEISDD